MARPSHHPRSTVATRAVKARRVVFDHADLDHRHYVDHDVLASHIVTVLSATIPDGERFISETVRRYRDQLDDPEFRAQANGFMGQEKMHQREHRRFNRALGKLGYPTAAIDRASIATFAVLGHLPPRLQVAMTAAIEHYTAVISEHVLADDDLRAADIPDEARAFLTWHMIEELEHKAVAFDTMQAVGTTEAERVAAMALVTVALIPAILGGLALSLATDPSAWNPRRLLHSLGHARRTAIARPRLLTDLLQYEQPGFHPDARDTTELLERWRAELLGPEGTLAGRVSSGARSA